MSGDLNDATTSGIYWSWVDENHYAENHMPFPYSFILMVIKSGSSTEAITQLFFSISGEQNLYFRVRGDDDTWSPWKKLN